MKSVVPLISISFLLVVLLVGVTKISVKKYLREEYFVFGHALRLQSTFLDRTWEQENEVVVQTVSETREHENESRAACNFFFLCSIVTVP